jgi:hypothetical protein
MTEKEAIYWMIQNVPLSNAQFLALVAELGAILAKEKGL